MAAVLTPMLTVRTVTEIIRRLHRQLAQPLLPATVRGSAAGIERRHSAPDCLWHFAHLIVHLTHSRPPASLAGSRVGWWHGAASSRAPAWPWMAAAPVKAPE